MRTAANWIKNISILLSVLLLAAQSQHFHHHGESHSHDDANSCEQGHNHPIHKHGADCAHTQHITEDCNYCDWQQPLVQQSVLTINFTSSNFCLAIFANTLRNPHTSISLLANSNKAPPLV